MNNRKDYSAIGAKPVSDYSEIGAVPVNKQPKQNDTFLGEMPEPKEFIKQISSPKMIDEMIRAAAFGGASPIANLAKPIQQFGTSVFSNPALGKPILEGVNKVAEKIPVIGKAINELIGQSPTLQKAIKATEYPLKGFMAGAAQDSEHPLKSGIMGGVLGTALPIMAKGFNALRPSNLLRGTQTPEELQRALDVTAGTQTPLGSVLQSPILKGTQENVLAPIPGSGVFQQMQQMRNNIIERGHGLLGQLLGNNSPQNVEGQIHSALGDVSKIHAKLKNSLYKNVDNLAEQSGLKLNLNNFAKTAQKYKEAIEDTNILKTEPEVKSLLTRLGRYTAPVEKVKGAIVNKEGEPLITSTKHPSLKEANILKGKLRDMGDSFSSSSNASERQTGKVLKQLSQSLHNDIKSELVSHGNEELTNAYNKAEENYSKNFSGFLDKEIVKFTHGHGDPDTIMQAFIKTGATDRAILLDKLAKKLPPDKRKLLGYSYLKQALDEEGVIDPMKLRQLISHKKLGPRQFEALFPDKAFRDQLRNYSHLTQKNESAFSTMFNPKTGNVTKSFLPFGMAGAGFGVAGVPGMIAAGLGGPLLARGANALLTSPKVRESLVNKMIQNSIK